MPVEQETVDCAHLFFVLQHVEKYQIFKQYLEETYRALKPGGVAVLYVGRNYVLSFNRSSRLRHAVDRLIERVILPGGYEELPARVNGTNLQVSLAQPSARPSISSLTYSAVWCPGGAFLTGSVCMEAKTVSS